MTGAAILVALIVLLVPELLSRPRHPGPQQTAAVDEAPIRSYRLSLGDTQRSATPLASTAPTAAASTAPATAPTPEAPGTAVKPAKPAVPTVAAPVTAATPTVTAVAPPAPARAVVPATRAASAEVVSHAKAVSHERAASSPKAARTEHASGGWAVQVGSFGSRENADRLVRSLKLKGYGAFITESPSRGRTWYRVRVGPERSRAAADATAARLRAAGLHGAVAQAR